MFTTARDKAKLLPSDLAKVLGVNRCTVSFWFNGRSEPHAMIRAKVEKLLAAIELAVQAGDLPIPHDVRHRERGLYLNRCLVRHLKAPDKAAA